jgi:asparagine synthase (glutamine-hydrolysing)
MPNHMRGKRFLASLSRSAKEDYIVGHAEYLARDLLNPGFLPNANSLSAYDISGPILQEPVPDDLDALCLHDLRLYLPDDILTKVDRMSMAVSLEVRVPLLDHRLVEFTGTLPRSLRLRDGVGKYLLKRLLGKYLPEDFVHRRKKGFSVPIGRWFRNELQDAFMDVAGPGAIRERGVFQPSVVSTIVDAHMSGRRDYQSLIWRLFVMQMWMAGRTPSDTVSANS